MTATSWKYTSSQENWIHIIHNCLIVSNYICETQYPDDRLSAMINIQRNIAIRFPGFFKIINFLLQFEWHVFSWFTTRDRCSSEGLRSGSDIVEECNSVFSSENTLKKHRNLNFTVISLCTAENYVWNIHERGEDISPVSARSRENENTAKYTRGCYFDKNAPTR